MRRMNMSKNMRACALPLALGCAMAACADASERDDGVPVQTGPQLNADPATLDPEVARMFPDLQPPPPVTPPSERSEQAFESAGPYDSDDDLVASGAWAKTQQSNAEIFRWSANQWDVPLRPANTHICFLTHVRGNLGGNSAVDVHKSTVDMQYVYQLLAITGASGGTVIDDAGDTWKLGGWQNSKNSLSAEATCVAASDFRGNPGAVIYYSPLAGVRAKSDWPGCSETQHAALWPNAAVGYITGLRGQFEGGGEKVEIVGVNTPGDTTGAKELTVRTEQCGEVDAPEGSARSLFVGDPVSSWYTGRTARVALSTAKKKPRKARLALTRDAVCYLTRISGNFDGAPESIRIYPELDEQGREWWAFEVKKGDGSAYGEAECVYYNQTTPPPLL